MDAIGLIDLHALKYRERETTMPAPAHFDSNVAETFGLGEAYYGDIDISPDLFAAYIWNIVCKHLKNSSDVTALLNFTTRLYLRDLYLTCGCVHKSEKAWTTFDLHYRRFIIDLVRFSYRQGTDTEEVADSVLVSLYFNDRSGRLRIASYDGRSSLATWLRVIVINRAINDRNERKLASDESVGDIRDDRAVANLESTMRAKRYGKILRESLAHALRQTTVKERLMLLWRYDQNLQLGEIAELLGIHQSNVTRQLVRLQVRLREAVVRALASQYQLSSLAIQECLADLVENPQISISLMSLIKETPRPSVAIVGVSLAAEQTDKVSRLASND